MPEWSSSNTRVFLCKAHHSLLVLRNIRHLFNTTPAGHLKLWNHQQNAQKHKNTAVKRQKKRHLYMVWELKQEGRAALCSTPAGDMHIRWTLVIHHDVHVPKWSQSVVNIDFGLHIKFGKKGYSPIQNLLIARIKCTFRASQYGFLRAWLVLGSQTAHKAACGSRVSILASKKLHHLFQPTQTHRLKTCIITFTALKWLQASNKPVQIQSKGQRTPSPTFWRRVPKF